MLVEAWDVEPVLFVEHLCANGAAQIMWRPVRYSKPRFGPPDRTINHGHRQGPVIATLSGKGIVAVSLAKRLSDELDG